MFTAGAGDDSQSNVLALAGLGLLVVTWYTANIYFNMYACRIGSSTSTSTSSCWDS